MSRRFGRFGQCRYARGKRRCGAKAIWNHGYCTEHEVKFALRQQPGARRWDTTVVYFIEAATVGMLKIGTSVSLSDRLSALQAMSPVPLGVVGTIRGGHQVEHWCHSLMADDRAHGEWFRDTPKLRAFITLLQEHGPEVASVLSPIDFMVDFANSEGIEIDIEHDGIDDDIGSRCRCDRCLEFVSRWEGK